MWQDIREWIVATVVVVVLVLAVVFTARQCEAGFCPSWRCFSSSSCGSDCVCMKQGMELQGRCVSFD